MTEKSVAKLERELARKEASLKRQEAKGRLLTEMSRHLGEANAIGAGELFEMVFQRSYKGNKITGCRALRELIEEVKYGDNPTLIAHSCSCDRPGYYIPVGSERKAYLDQEDEKIKRKIGRLARLNRVSAAAYAGQLALTIQEAQG